MMRLTFAWAMRHRIALAPPHAALERAARAEGIETA